MIWPTIRFIWQETRLELRRERLIAVTTISTVAVLLLLLGLNLLFVMDLRGWAQRMEQEISVTGYFERDLPRREATHLAQTVATWPEVKSAQFVTREQLWTEFSTEVVDANRLKGLNASILFDCVRVQAQSASLVPGLVRKLAGLEGVRDVVPGTAKEQQGGRVWRFVNSVIRFRQLVEAVALVVVLLVALVGLLVVHNTIRLAMHARWREIYIMQLVGATRALVSAPFLLQGMIHGAIGAVLACCVLIPTHLYLGEAIRHSDRAFWQLQPEAAVFAFGGYLVLAGMVLGLLGSALSLRKVLRHRPEWQS